MKTRLRSYATIVAMLTALPVVCGTQTVQAGEDEMFSQSQKVGYLGQTSRQALARNVLDRMQSQTEAPLMAGSGDRVLAWHEILLDSVALDHTPDPDEGGAPLDQGGPTRTSRALAITQIAVFDAVNAFDLNFQPYNDIGAAPADASIDAAIAYASHTAQVALFPSQQSRLDSLLASDIDQIVATEEEIEAGKMLGQLAADAILLARSSDNSSDPEPDFGEGGVVADGNVTFNGTPVNGGTTQRFEWEPDPLTPPVAGEFNLALGASWGAVTPFTLESGDQFRVPPPPRPGSFRYIRGFWQVQLIGASPDSFFSLSNPLTRFIGNYWGYDAVPLLGTPPRLYNQIAIQVAIDEGLGDVTDLARYLALINTSLADSGISSWDSKYFYNYWRPVTGIRRPDGVRFTFTNRRWRPVGVSVINTELPITPTPPFPAYPSGHSTFGASTFEIMRDFFGNRTRFTFVSDEFNGEGVDPLGVPRPLVPVRFTSLSSAQRSNGISRIFNGVHWEWDNTSGQQLGVDVARHLLDTESAFQPIGDE